MLGLLALLLLQVWTSVSNAQESLVGEVTSKKVAGGVVEARNDPVFTEEISGIVVDREGLPVGGTTIKILSEDDVDPARWPDHIATSQLKTDDQGQFVLRKVPPGKYRLLVTDRGGNASSSLATARAGDNNLRLLVDRRPLLGIPTLEGLQIVDLTPSMLGQSQLPSTKQPVLKQPLLELNEGAPDGYVAIRGRLVGPDGNPISGAVLTARLINTKERIPYRTILQWPAQ